MTCEVAEIQYWQSKFRVLKDWVIDFEPDAIYKGQCCHDIKGQKAAIYEWGPNSQEPDDYIFHEILHLAAAAAFKSDSASYAEEREKEETFVQDVCTVFRELNETILDVVYDSV